jgi:hypothetical protein
MKLWTKRADSSFSANEWQNPDFNVSGLSDPRAGKKQG